MVGETSVTVSIISQTSSPPAFVGRKYRDKQWLLLTSVSVFPVNINVQTLHLWHQMFQHDVGFVKLAHTQWMRCECDVNGCLHSSRHVTRKWSSLLSSDWIRQEPTYIAETRTPVLWMRSSKICSVNSRKSSSSSSANVCCFSHLRVHRNDSWSSEGFHVQTFLTIFNLSSFKWSALM